MGIFGRKPTDDTPPPLPDEGQTPNEPTPAPIKEQAQGTPGHLTPAPTKEDAQEAPGLPALSLKTIVRSAAPVTNEQQDIRDVIPWNEYTIVDRKDIIEVYDGMGRKMEDFDAIGSRKARVGWVKVGRKHGDGCENIGYYGGNGVFQARRLPSLFQKVLKITNPNVADGGASGSVSWSSLKDPDDLSGEISTANNGKYLVIFDEQRQKYLVEPLQKSSSDLR